MTNRLGLTLLAAGLMTGGLLSGAAAAQPGPSPPDALQPYPEAEREIRRIYATFFKRTRNPAMHDRGWAELERHLADARLYELILGLFADASFDLRAGLLERFVEQATDDADVVLAWVAVFDDSDAMREHAAGRLTERIGDGEPSHRVQIVLSEGLKSPNDESAVAAAELVQAFNLLRAVPMLAQAQALPRRSEEDVRTGALAQIVVGTQQAFVQNLTPVVAASAVGFQPTIGVVSSGTVLRVMDAVVWEYRTDIHRVLVGMTSAATGESTSRLGYDTREWLDWYAAELKPRLDSGEL